MIGELSALATACFWAGSALAFAGATTRIGAVQVNVMRLLFASVFLAVTIAALTLSIHLSFSQIGKLAISGVLGLTFGDTFLFKSYDYNGPRVSMLIMSIAPAISAILAYIFIGEVVSWMGIFGMLITLAGIVIVVLEQRETSSSKYPFSLRGVFYGFLGAVGQASGLVLAKMALAEGEINGFVATLVRIIASLILLIPIAMMTRRLNNPIKVFSNDKKAFKLTVLGAILGPYFGITLSLVSITYTNIGIAATLMAMTPIAILPLVKIIHKEVLSWRAIIGALVAVAGVAILFLR
ncbi:MAG: DMT family transporter [Ignavibacteriales bacterium]|nr:DMT family transporter [Ignavibacteriales bacterium]MBI3789008.1 DMT family transporter [Ignavibacteriales bacterium]